MTFVNDTFTDTAGTSLAGHTGETGATWTVHTAGPGDTVISNANRMRKVGTATTALYASGLPASADYDVECVLHRVGTGPAESNGVTGRMVTGAVTFYYARYNTTAGAWELFKFVAGAATSLGTYSQSTTVGVDYALKLQMRGTAIKLYVDGVERISATDSAISAAGRAGVRLAATGTVTDTEGLHFGSFTASDVGDSYPLPQVKAGQRAAVSRAAFY